MIISFINRGMERKSLSVHYYMVLLINCQYGNWHLLEQKRQVLNGFGVSP